MSQEPKDEVSTHCMLNGLVESNMMPTETCSQDLQWKKNIETYTRQMFVVG